jgi:hypothetical protein
MADLTASADIHGRAITLSLAWSDPSSQARSLRVVRRRSGYAQSPDDGLSILDLAELFQVAFAPSPWALIRRKRFLIVDAPAEGGVLQAELAEYYTSSGDPQPSQVSVRSYDSTAGALVSAVISSVTRVTSSIGTSPGFGVVTTLTIYAQPGGGPEAPAGTLVLSTQGVSPGPVTTVADYTQPAVGTDTPPLIIETLGASLDRLDWIPVAHAVTAATNASPIAITTASKHGLSSGGRIVIAGVTGNTAANGTWTILVTSPTTFTLTGSAGNGTYAGGGTALPPAASVSFGLQEEQHTVSTMRAIVPLDVSFDTGVVVTGSPDAAIRSVEFTEAQNPDTGEIGRSITITDRDPPTRDMQRFQPGLHPGVTYYYAAWEDPGTGYPVAPSWTAFSIATGHHGFSAKLFAMLPAVHRYYDDPASGPQPGTGLPGSWQLRRFLQVVGPALDQARSLGESLQSLQDIFEARADVLPYLASWIGWEVDRTLSTQRQRTDILFAPEVFATIGTLPNIEALVHRSTGWVCQAKEFVNNIFLTNFVERIRLWEIWQAPPAFGVLTLPVAQTWLTQAVNDSIDARPAVVAEPLGGSPWLFWHSTRTDATRTPPSTHRQIWMQRLDGSAPPHPVMQGAPDHSLNLTFSDEWPTVIADGGVVRLFWSSNRGGAAGIWTRSLTGGVPGDATRLTKHEAGDHCPAVARDASGTLWLFWHSSRRGPTDIWAMTLAPGATAWSMPTRITSGRPRDQMPTAFLDAENLLRLTWSADLGDRSRILQSTLNGPIWSQPVTVSSDSSDVSTFRDEAPAAIQWNATVWVFWSSNRDGIYRLWASQQTGASWSAPVTVTTGRHEEKEPAAFIDGGGALRLFFRTQQSGELFRSRTVDMSNVDAIKRGLFDDRWHYTYSVATDPTSYYARDTVGLYITPDQTANLDEADRVRTLVEPFRPLPVRFVWFVQPAVVTETVYSPVDIRESYIDSAEYLGPIGETFSVALPQWSIFHTNTLGDVSANPADLTTLRRRVFYPAPT